MRIVNISERASEILLDDCNDLSWLETAENIVVAHPLYAFGFVSKGVEFLYIEHVGGDDGEPMPVTKPPSPPPGPGPRNVKGGNLKAD